VIRRQAGQQLSYFLPGVAADNPLRIKDPFGNIWWVVSHVEDVSEDDMWQRLRDPVYAEAMRVAHEALDAELGGRPDGRSSAPVRATDRPNSVRQTA